MVSLANPNTTISRKKYFYGIWRYLSETGTIHKSSIQTSTKFKLETTLNAESQLRFRELGIFM